MALVQVPNSTFGNGVETPGQKNPATNSANFATGPQPFVDSGTFGGTSDTSDTTFITTIGNQSFRLEVWMDNQIDGFPPFAVPAQFIEEIQLEESLLNWNTRGWVTINTDYEILERGFPAMKFSDFLSGNKIKNPYVVRTDGRNRLYIRLYPILKDSTNRGLTSYDLYLQNWEICLNSVIYDIEDLDAEKAYIKKRRFYFWDERYQILLERNLEWSTATHGPNGGNISGTDKERSMPISNAIQSIIKTAASNKFKQEAEDDVKIGGGNIASKMSLFADTWDRGFGYGKENSYENSVLYTSPANSTAIDDINYMLALFKSEDGTPAVLALDRFFSPNGKRFDLKSIGNIIKDAEKNQIERLFIDDLVDPEAAGMHFNRAPDGRGADKNFSSPIASIIRNYKFCQMSPTFDLSLINSPVHNFSFQDKEFRVYKKDNSIKKFLEKTKEYFTEGLYSFQQGSGKVLLNITKSKTEGIMTKNVLVPQTFFPSDYSFINNFLDYILSNQTIYFEANGLTLRTPGKFIYIDRPLVTQDKNSFDDRFLGQWLMTKVTHKFTKSSYTNEVYAVKPDIFNKYWEELENKY